MFFAHAASITGRATARYAIIARHSPEPALNSDNAQTNASSRSGLDWFSAGL